MAARTDTRKTKDSAGSRDKIFGLRLRQRRTFLGFSQQMLGDAVGMTFQQIQKYEHGTNKISASRLIDFSKVLGARQLLFCRYWRYWRKNAESAYGFGRIADITKRRRDA